MEKFSEIKYERPNPGKLKKECAKLIARFREAKTFEEADEAFLAFQRINESWETQNILAMIRNTMNMKDEFYESEIKFFNRESPKMSLTLKKGIKAALASPFRAQFEEKYGRQLFRAMEMGLKLIKPSIILPSIAENNVCTAYSKTAAGCSVEFMGEKCNFYGLLRHMQSEDRGERKAAFEEWAKLYEGISEKLDSQYKKLVSIRRTIARRLGLPSFVDYSYSAARHYDYDAAKIAEFREAVRTYITPLCEKLFREQAERLGLEKLEWYDEEMRFAEGNAVPEGTPEELIGKAREMYEAMSPETAEFFNFMTEHELLDVVTRENKHLGGYMTFLTDYKAPFIFSNFNGTSADVNVLTHEAGHAFEGYYASRRLPLSNQVASTSDINEIHSMAMEFFAYPYMESFFADKADEYRFTHFTESIMCIPYLVSVDEFQHRVFGAPGSGPADWRRFWKETEQKYMPWRSYDGNEFLEGGGFWMQKQHIFLYPFYYVDYAMAELDAIFLYRKRLEGGDAWGSYLTLCGMGGKYGYFETLERAGLPNPLEPQSVKALAEFAEAHARELLEKVGE